MKISFAVIDKVTEFCYCIVDNEYLAHEIINNQENINNTPNGFIIKKITEEIIYGAVE